MKKSLICLAVLAVMSQPVFAEKWSAIGILVTKVNGNEIEAKALELDDFESSDLCWKAVKKYSHSEETIG